MSWPSYTLRRQYLQLMHNTDTDIYNSRAKELCVPVNNLITLRQHSLGYNIHKQTLMTITLIITHGITPNMAACITIMNLYSTLHWVIKIITILRLNIYMWPTKKGTLTHLQLLSL